MTNEYEAKIKGIITRRNDGIGTRLMSLLSTRFACDLFGCDMYLTWPRIVSQYYSENILNEDSIKEVFENGQVFKDFPVQVIEDVIFSDYKATKLTSIEQKFKQSGFFYLLENQQENTIADNEFFIWDTSIAIVPFPKTIEEVTSDLKVYWSSMNWNNKICSSISCFHDYIESDPYLVIHLRRGDIMERLLHYKLDDLERTFDVIIRRFIPINSVVKYILDSSYSKVVICSEDEEQAQKIIELVKTNDQNKLMMLSSFFSKSLSETQSAIFDLLVMSSGEKVVAPISSSFSSCAEIVGVVKKINLSAVCSSFWSDVEIELNQYIDQHNPELFEKRKSLVSARTSAWREAMSRI